MRAPRLHQRPSLSPNQAKHPCCPLPGSPSCKTPCRRVTRASLPSFLSPLALTGLALGLRCSSHPTYTSGSSRLMNLLAAADSNGLASPLLPEPFPLAGQRLKISPHAGFHGTTPRHHPLKEKTLLLAASQLGNPQSRLSSRQWEL